MALKTKEIGLNYFNIKDTLHQVFKHPKFSFTRVANVDIARKMQDGEISDQIVEIIKFIYDVHFATQDQISRAVGLNVDEEILSELTRLNFLNYFVLSDFPEDKLVDNPEDLRIYVLDFAGIYVLNYSGVDTLSWRFPDYFKSSKVVKNCLVQAEVVIAFRNLKKLRIRDYKESPEFRLGKVEASTDFSFSLEQSENIGAKPLNIVGFVAENGREDLRLSERLRDINVIFKETKAGLKYYPLGEENLPILLVIAETSTDTGHLKRVANVIGRCSDFAGAECLIVGYDELVAKGFSDANIYSINTSLDQTTQIKNVNIGRIKNSTLV